MTTASKPAPPKPAGPGPKPAGPTRPTPTGPPPRDLADGTGGPWPSAPGPSNPGGPTGPGRLAAALDSIDLLLMTAQVVAADKIGNGFPAERFALTRRLDLARRAVADLALALQTPARLRPRSAGPDRAGGPPAPGAGTFSLPPIPTVPSFDNGRCAQGWPPPSVPWPGRPFPVYEVPAP